MKDSYIDSQKRLEQILKAISEIEKYVLDEDGKSFCDNGLVQDAVLMQFIVIGESINFVESEKLLKYDYPWYKVKSFRNMIAHEYFNIKMRAVWEIIQKDLPKLKSTITIILESEF
ncbi:MAG: DUF86 domain-containing protein [Mongoliibacter sp.]|uniref:HepT-like ribonuclease domain-containing protein n=1 Tax=Mongoliibacter sp. TaxID=2022438 RepID=UPI0012F05AFF|nr:HepT-like ribonuclease domain-containing protein [Mongoliibacter sp.]TVP53391.1 MAG: DUF86 domain-containing protein [Mongoliibacter sp.]